MPRGKTRLTPRERRREFAETAPGVVRVRLAGDTFASDVLVQILREHPSVEILTGPDRYDGNRQYLLVRVATPAEVLEQPGETDRDRDVPEAADIAPPFTAVPRLPRVRPLPYADPGDEDELPGGTHLAAAEAQRSAS